MASRGMVHLVYDDRTVRHSLSFFLRSSGYAVTCWESSFAFLDGAKNVSEGCVIIGIRMPQRGGFQLQRAFCGLGIAWPVIYLADQTDVATVLTAMRQGAVDVLEEPFEQTLLLQALDRGFTNIAHMNRVKADAHEAKERISRLSRHEQDVLCGLLDGRPNKAIAFELGISRRTVEVHRAHMMTKLGVHTLSDALRLAYTAGLWARQHIS